MALELLVNRLDAAEKPPCRQNQKTKKAIEEAREELRHADTEEFDRVLRALVRVPSNELKTKGCKADG